MAALAVFLCVLVFLGALAYLLGLAMSQRAEPMRDRVAIRLGRFQRPVHPDGRPIEEIVGDLRRLGARYHGLHPHTSFAKVEAVRTAYDRVLAECCTSLGLTHLLGVLPLGPELDAERERVEELLADSGVRFPHPA